MQGNFIKVARICNLTLLITTQSWLLGVGLRLDILVYDVWGLQTSEIIRHILSNALPYSRIHFCNCSTSQPSHQLLGLDSLPHLWCSPAGSWVATMACMNCLQAVAFCCFFQDINNNFSDIATISGFTLALAKLTDSRIFKMACNWLPCQPHYFTNQPHKQLLHHQASSSSFFMQMNFIVIGRLLHMWV